MSEKLDKRNCWSLVSARGAAGHMPVPSLQKVPPVIYSSPKLQSDQHLTNQ